MVNPPRRRPRGDGGVTTRSLLTWSFLCLLLAGAAESKLDNQYAPSLYHPDRKAVTTASAQLVSPDSSSTQPGRSPAELGNKQNYDEPTYAKFRNTDTTNLKADRYQDALAPAHLNRAVRAPLAAQPAGAPHGVSSLHQPARLLQDWEVEDIMLFTTVDGSLHARDRKTGRGRWSIEMPGSPMIETINYPREGLDPDAPPDENDYIFIVEPSKDGQLYAHFLDPRKGLQKVHKTVREMAAEAPATMNLNGHQLGVVMETSVKFYTIDVATGQVLSEFPRYQSSLRAEPQPRCLPRNDQHPGDSSCLPGRTIRVGRQQYSFTLSDMTMNQDKCTIKFTEWTLDKVDNDLQQQYHHSFDNIAIQSYHNGRFKGIDMMADEDRNARFTGKLDSPIAGVFDIIRPLNDPEAENLVLLSRPMNPGADQVTPGGSERVFVNKIGTGQWFAMSDRSYPGVTAYANFAKVKYNKDGNYLDQFGPMDEIVGVHDLAQMAEIGAPPVLTLPGPPDHPENGSEEGDLSPVEPGRPPSLPPGTKSDIWNPWILVIACLFLGIGALGNSLISKSSKPLAAITTPRVEATSVPVANTSTSTSQATSTSPSTQVDLPATRLPPETPAFLEADGVTVPLPTLGNKEEFDGRSDEDSGDEDNGTNDGIGEPKTPANGKRKKTPRGKRGSGKNKKKAKADPEAFEDKPILAVEQNLKDGQTQIGRLVVDTNEASCLGCGSNGTAVYPGQLDGRQVAVKRLVKSTNDLARKEIKHLLSSGQDPNVIQYFGKEESKTFFYIALDRFTTSLDQFVERPDRFPSLVSESQGFDVKDCLRQITSGISYIHDLKLVHRDIKPQNVLVRAKDTKREIHGIPKLQFVITDFGLCKPLEEGAMSTFAPTANHTAAGTTGWRAPELLVGPRDSIASPQVVNSVASRSSTTSHSADGTVIDPPTGRRATKAIDIFSLGCVYYYVMTQGGHPFDKNGVSVGRDLNIMENHFTTELLRLHDYQYDADDLVMQMIKHYPKERPSAGSVLRHPYFWDEDDKLKFICLVSDRYERLKQSITDIHNPNAVHTAEEEDALNELAELQAIAPNVIGTKNDHEHSIRDFLSALPKSFLSEMGKQRKYTGTKMIDLLRVIRNKWSHVDDLPEDVRGMMLGGTPAGYYRFWASRFPSLLVNCHCLVLERGLVEKFRFESFYD